MEMSGLKIYRVKFPSGFEVTAHAADEAAAMAKAYAFVTEPQYCRIHDEIKDRSDAPVGEMGHFTPSWPQPVAAREMREVYMGGGYCTIPV